MTKTIPSLARLSSLVALIGLSTACARADWRSDSAATIEKIRKGDFALQLLDSAGRPLAGAKVEYQLARHDFLFGTAISYKPFADQTAKGEVYRRFILENFSALVCENEMKGYFTEPEQGKSNYAPADALLAFAEQHHLRMRGHCLFWEKAEHTQDWVKALNDDEFARTIDARLHAAAGRYAGRLVSWDVNNEQLDGSTYLDRIGRAGIARMHQQAAALDPKAMLFVNEYGILGNPEKTERYIALIKELQALGAPVGGIGVQSHDLDRLVPGAISDRELDKRPEWLLQQPLSPEQFIATLDQLHSATGLPIHLTEASAKMPDPAKRADALEILFRAGFGHPAVGAVMLWGFQAGAHWMGPDAALLAADGTPTEAGRRISHLLREEWTSRGNATADDAGQLGFRGFYGIYNLKITLPDGRVVKQELNLDKANATGVQTVRL